MSKPNSDPEQPAGLLFIIAAPSGAGKTSLVKALLDADPGLSFRAMVERGEFLEYAMVFGNYYGTHRQALADQLKQGLDVILEIDWQGAAQVREIFPDCISIFILPPSLDVLRERLSRRAQDSESVIARRMRDARSEISHCLEFDQLVINEEFELALQEIRGIIDAARRGEQPERREYTELLAELLGNG